MNFPFAERSRSSGDLNDMTQMGIYRVAGSGFANAPSSSIYGTLLVLRDKSSYGVQVLFDSSTGRAYWRGFIFTEGSFYDWRQITTTAV